MKKLLTFILIAIFAVVLFAACNGNGGNGGNSGSDGKKDSFSASEIETDSSPYDDDWYQSETSQSSGKNIYSSAPQSSDFVLQSSEGDSSSQRPSVSYEDEDDNEWTPFL